MLMAIYLQSRGHGSLNDATLSDNAMPLREQRRKVSVIASTLMVRTKPSSAEGLMIDGYLECAMAHHETLVTISEHACVEADIHARSVDVFGRVIGDIFSSGKVSLAKGSDVRGDICCSGLYIEDGARFKGRVAMR
jgi:cytoskeletal protein CcmA (bactofilin family)